MIAFMNKFDKIRIEQKSQKIKEKLSMTLNDLWGHILFYEKVVFL